MKTTMGKTGRGKGVVMQSPLEMLKEFFNSQDHVAVKAGDFDKVEYTVSPTKPPEGGIKVEIESEGIGFTFDAEGRFVGLYNWKG